MSENHHAASSAAAKPRRRKDSAGRKREIAEASERVIAERGVEGLTHRAVAAEANLALGATTYHFKDRDDLIQAALERSVDQFAAYLVTFSTTRSTESVDDLVERLTDSVMTACGPDRQNAVVQYELFVAAFRRPALKSTADRSRTLGVEALQPPLPPVRARAVAAALGGLILHGLAGAHPPERAEIRNVLRDICHLPPMGNQA